MRLSSILCWTADEMRSRRSDERPMDSGFAEGNSCAKAEVTDAKAANKQAAIMRYRMVVRCKGTSWENGASLQSGALGSHGKMWLGRGREHCGGLSESFWRLDCLDLPH